MDRDQIFFSEVNRNSFRTWGRQTTVPCVIGSRYVPRQASLPPDDQKTPPLGHGVPPLQIPSSTRSKQNTAQASIGKIRPDLYKNLQKPEPESTKNGSLTFGLHFIPSENQLRVRIIKAADLPPKDLTGTSDPYVKVQLLPETKTKYQTKVVKKCLFPSFNETFVFEVSHEELPNRMLQLTVYDFDRFTRHDFIGRALIPDILHEPDIYSEALLTKHLTNVEGADKAELGDLMLTLVYLPSARRLTVIVVKAVNLKIMDITGASDPYVKVSLIQGGKRIRKRKTSVHRRTVNPVFNEALFFDIGEEQLDDSHLLVQVIDHDRIGRNELIGALEIGCHVTGGSGGVHWRDCIAHARKPVTMWHTLIDVRTLKRNSVAVIQNKKSKSPTESSNKNCDVIENEVQKMNLTSVY
ncbi:synaptotagmin-6-like isoform X2 [Symsagittifera roscoffensis]|uniref:synaptotagmin-6-like isoform X2 n=1 Tax=Symsagittifera roscoffensis TaxID=84072 RepID=UPI00307C8D3A